LSYYFFKRAALSSAESHGYVATAPLISFSKVSLTRGLEKSQPLCYFWTMTGHCRLAIPLGRGAVKEFPYGVASTFHDGKRGLIGNTGLPRAATNMLVFIREIAFSFFGRRGCWILRCPGEINAHQDHKIQSFVNNRSRPHCL
jgi:hypothetical protein